MNYKPIFTVAALLNALNIYMGHAVLDSAKKPKPKPIQNSHFKDISIKMRLNKINLLLNATQYTNDHSNQHQKGHFFHRKEKG